MSEHFLYGRGNFCGLGEYLYPTGFHGCIGDGIFTWLAQLETHEAHNCGIRGSSNLPGVFLLQGLT